MATTNERLASSLSELRKYQEENNTGVVKGSSTLGRTHLQRLVENGWLEPVIKGWYISSSPEDVGSTSVWYANYWNFIVEYCNNRYGDDWSLTAEESLTLHSGNMVVPTHIVIRSPKATNNMVELKHGHSLLEISSPAASDVTFDPIYGIRLYSIAEALLFTSPNYFRSDPVNARASLASLENSAQIVRIASNNGISSKAGRIIGALKNIGRDSLAEEILKFMQRLGYDIRVEDPFDDVVKVTASQSPYETRIKLLWEKMRKQIVSMNLNLSHNKIKDMNAILKSMESNYVKDAYHSLSIEGYRVTESLIERVKSGAWNPDNEDADRRNALAARGYFQAFQRLQKSVSLSLGGTKIALESEINDWHYELFEPCVQAGIISPTDLIGYRTMQVYIRGSKHTPLPVNAVNSSIHALCELIENEDDDFVKAVLAHFFFVYIHPYMDGNGRTARFLMNMLLCSSGYSWIVVPVERRSEYMHSLEKASIEEDIRDFTKFILSLLD